MVAPYDGGLKRIEWYPTPDRRPYEGHNMARADNDLYALGTIMDAPRPEDRIERLFRQARDPNTGYVDPQRLPTLEEVARALMDEHMVEE